MALGRAYLVGAATSTVVGGGIYGVLPSVYPQLDGQQRLLIALIPLLVALVLTPIVWAMNERRSGRGGRGMQPFVPVNMPGLNQVDQDVARIARLQEWEALRQRSERGW